MRPANILLIKEHYKQIWDDFEAIQFMDLTGHERGEVLRMYREEVDPGYADMTWCGNCTVEIFKNIIRLYEQSIHTPHSTTRA